MQREIKFRGLTLEEKFKYGFLIKQGPYFFIQNDKGGNDAIIENSIGQFTGFFDKKGNEIYEDDIIGDWSEIDGHQVQSRQQVFFDQESGQWVIDNSRKQDKSIHEPLHKALKDFDYEIVGNIYDAIIQG